MYNQEQKEPYQIKPSGCPLQDIIMEKGKYSTCRHNGMLKTIRSKCLTINTKISNTGLFNAVNTNKR